jgi:putative ABC transport system ATP-binding protein
MSGALLELVDACKIYGQGLGEVHALRHVSVSVKKGEFIALIGPSGSGKSTLLNIIGGLDTLTSGSFRFAGMPIDQLDADGRSRYRHSFTGFIFQDFNLLRRTSALENVELPLLYRKIPSDLRRRRAIEALEQVGMAHRAHHKPTQLSGGEQQRVAIARALVCNPVLIVADEPTGNLDSARTDEILTLLDNVRATRETTLVMVTHDPDVARRARRLIEFRDGHIIGDRMLRVAHAA